MTKPQLIAFIIVGIAALAGLHVWNKGACDRNPDAARCVVGDSK